MSGADKSKKQTQQLILGSASKGRLSLIRQLGIEPDQITPADIDETPQNREAPQPYVKRMALEKNQALNSNVNLNKHYILTGDTTVAVGRRIIGKAETREQAKEFLELFSGRSHQVISAIALYNPNNQKVTTRINNSRVKFKRLSNQEIEYYLDLEQWQGCAGAYTLQAYANSFIEKIIGSYSSIVGLPLCETRKLLIGANYLKADGSKQ